MSRPRFLVAVLLAAFCAGTVVVVELVRPRPYTQLEYGFQDFVARFGRMTQPNPDLVFLAIDSDSVALDPSLDVDGLFASTKRTPGSRGALEMMAKGWPWDREIYAMILERLVQAGAKVVVFDCLFPTAAPGDDAFRVALERFKSQVVIGSNFVTPDDVDRSRRIASSYQPPAETLIPRTSIPDERVGFTNFFTSENKIVHSAQFRVAFRQDGNTTETYTSLSARAVACGGRAELVPNDLGDHLIRFTGPPRVGFRPHPIFEIFVPEYWEHNYRSGESLRGKTVVIGAEGKWQHDELLTPFGAMPGGELHLNVINALRQREFLSKVSPLAAAILTALAAVLGAGLCLIFRSAWLRLLALIAIDAALPAVALWLYNHPGIYLPSVALLLAINATVFIGLVSDFTFERIEKARLRSTLKTRDDLTHMIVHDLRSPLTIVSGYVDALQQMAAGKLTPSEEKYFAEAKRGANDMRDMITTLLDLGRLEAGEMPLRLQPHDVNEIARKAAARFSPILDQRTLHCDALAAPVLISCDADVIRRVLENLISNAIKFTRSNGRIVVRVQPDAEEVMISVRDDGQGIPPDQHKHIFEKFGQTATGGEQRHSSGIGLAFCRMAVEAHDGKIRVQSEPGKGSTFSFTLPSRDQAPLHTVAEITA